MKFDAFRRLLSTGLILGMLLPWMMTAPVSAAQTANSVNEGTVLYSKTADEMYAAGSSHSTWDRQVTQYWNPNTQDIVNGTKGARRDVALYAWSKIWGPKETGTSGYLAQLRTNAVNDSNGVFDYGLAPDPDGTPGSLSLTLNVGDNGRALSLNTNKYGEIILTLQYARADLSNPSIDHVGDGFQVLVSTNGGATWKAGYAGMKSHRVIAEGNLNASGTGSLVRCYEVISEDLTALAEGETINAIRIRPFGDFDDFTSPYTYVRSISITGYQTAASDASAEYVPVDGDILRQIVTAHAKRLNGDSWTSSQSIATKMSWEDGEMVSGRTYYKNLPFKGPIYSQKNASTYELFLSDIDANGNYIGALKDEEYGENGLSGMDCSTVVYDCLSQITSSRSLSSWYYFFHDLYDAEDNPNGKAVPLYPAAKQGSIDRDSHDEYFDQLVSASGGQSAMYALYDSLKPGDFLFNEAHTRVITSPTINQTVYVGETAGTIQHYYKKVKDGSEVTTTALSYMENPEAYEARYQSVHGEEIEYQYSSSMRYDRPLKYTTGATKSIYDDKYLPYTMREYTTGLVEKENVLLATNNPTKFITDGFCAAIDSNYTVRTHTVSLVKKAAPAAPLYSKTLYGVQSDFSVLFADTALDAKLASLGSSASQYELKIEVLSGPRIYLDNGSVITNVADAANTVNPTTTFTVDLATGIVSKHSSTNNYSLPFEDVPADAYYRNSVRWALENGVTSGTSATTFSPDMICTRAHAVTFMWNVAGQPDPVSTSMPFNDVPVGSYYYKSVLWAVENNITSGTSATTFSPDDPCTRAQIITLLWKSLKSPVVDTPNPFTDVTERDYYYNAVRWAFENNVSTGIAAATTISPHKGCTRAEMVTFLQRVNDMK